MFTIAILAGGYAKRLGPISRLTPKILVEVNSRPFVDWQLELLMKNGYSDFVFCLSHMADQIQSYLGDGREIGARIRYSLDGAKQLGTGGAIIKALPLLGERFAVIYGDSYLPTSYKKVEDSFISKQLDALITIYENHGKFDSSNIRFADGLILDYQKGATSDFFRHIDYGLSYFNSSIFRAFPGNKQIDLSEVYRSLISKKNLFGFEVFERFYEIGSPSGINDLSEFLEGLSDDL